MSKTRSEIESEIYNLCWDIKNGDKHPHDVFLRILEILESQPVLAEGQLQPMSAEKAFEIAKKAGIFTPDGELTDDYKHEE